MIFNGAALLLAVTPIIIFYWLVIATTKGRCSRREYFIKTMLILVIVFTALVIIALSILLISFLMMIILWIAAYSYLKFTIQRLYDLGMPWYYLLLTVIPIVGLIMTIVLFVKRAGIEPNDRDEPIKYGKICKGKHFLNIFDDKIFFDSIEFRTEYHLGKYKIKIANYMPKNIFADYLRANYPSQEERVSRGEFVYTVVEATGNDLLEIIKKLKLIVLYESHYIKIRGYKLFMRYYNFGYDIIINKKDHQLTKDMIDTFDFPGSYFEDENYIYYNKIPKEKIRAWIKNAS